MQPVVEVSSLPSASSFYSAITQPLDIRYIPSPPAVPQTSSTHSLLLPSFSSKPQPTSPTILSVTQPALSYGAVGSKEAVFQIRQVVPTKDKPLRTSHLVLAATSLNAVNDFHAAALKAFPRSSAVIGTRASFESDSATAIGTANAGAASLEQSDICARVTDFDGNTMEVAYFPASYSYPSYYGGSPSRHHSAHDYDYDPNRVLYYSYDTPSAELFSPRSGSGSRFREMPNSYEYSYHDVVPASSSSRYQGSRGRTATLRRSATSTSGASYEGPSSSRYSSRESFKNMSTAGMLGMAAVGAAAGAAITYSVMHSSSRSRSASSHGHEFDNATAIPSFQRRSTFPDSYQEYSGSRYGGHDGGMRGRSQKATREVEDVHNYDSGRGRLTSSREYRPSGGSVGGSGSRARSEAAFDRSPLMISDGEIRGSGSYISSSSRHGPAGAPPLALSSSRRGSTYDYHGIEPADRTEPDNYVSGARSHRSIRGSGGGGSRLPSTPPNASRSAPVRQGMSRSGSYMSARNIPLPPSGAGGSYPQWDDDSQFGDDNRFLYDDDNDSVAPSDSISCVGSRSHSRRHRR